jgi:hypothetical protein
VTERGGRPERDVVISALRQGIYESGRPAPDVACRVGDERFLNIRAAQLQDEDDTRGATS